MGENLKGNLEKKFVPKYKPISLNDDSKKYSPIHLGSYDKTRHVLLGDSYGLLNNEGLSREKLDTAISRGEISVYTIDGQQYLDRLDIGRIYHDASPKEGLTIERYFSKDYENPLDSVKYTERHLKIDDFKTGKAKFEMTNAEIPEWMNDVDASIVADKYFFKPTKDKWKEKLKEKIGSENEFSLKHLSKRVGDFFTDEGWKLGYFKTEEEITHKNKLLEIVNEAPFIIGLTLTGTGAAIQSQQNNKNSSNFSHYYHWWFFYLLRL